MSSRCIESIRSAATLAVENVNDPATGFPLINDTTPTVGQSITATPGSIADLDGLLAATYAYLWESSADGVTWTTRGNAATLVVPNIVGEMLRVTASFTDDNGTAESQTSVVTAPVGPAPPPPVPASAGGPVSLLTSFSITRSAAVGKTTAATPFSVSVNLSAPADVRMDVRRTNGMLVRRIVRKNVVGPATIKWNLRDQKGRRVKAGTYRIALFISQNGEIKHVAAKMVKVPKAKRIVR